MKNKKGSNNFLFWLAIIIGGIGTGALIATKTSIFDVNTKAIKYVLILLLTFVITLIGMIFNTIIHELGHLVFGLLSGYKFVSFRIGSTLFTKENGKIKKKKFEIHGSLGQCLLDPPEPKNGLIPVYLYNMGGVFFNLLLTIIEVVLFFVLVKFNEVIAAIILVFALSNYLITISNGIPRKTALLYNDGYNAIKARENKEANKAFYCVMKVNTLLTNNVSYMDMPDSYFYMPDLYTMDNPIVASAAYQYLAYLMGINKYDEALKISKLLLSSNNIEMAGIYRILMMAENIYNYCLIDDKGNATAYYNENNYRIYSATMTNIPSILRAKYAYELLINENLIQANKAKELFYKAYGNYPYKEEVKEEIALFEKIDEVYKERHSK